MLGTANTDMQWQINTLQWQLHFCSLSNDRYVRHPLPASGFAAAKVTWGVKASSLSLLSKRCKYASLQKQEAVLLLPNWCILHLLKIVTASYSHTFHSCSDHQWWSAQSHGSDYWPACCHVSVIVGYAIASSTSPSSSGVGNTCSQQGDISRLWKRCKEKQAGNQSLECLSLTHTQSGIETASIYILLKCFNHHRTLVHVPCTTYPFIIDAFFTILLPVSQIKYFCKVSAIKWAMN